MKLTMKNIKKGLPMREIFVISNNLPQNLSKLGFRPLNLMDNQYVYYFPVVRNSRNVSLTGRILAYTDDKKVTIDVIDNNGIFYYPFYNESKYGNYEIILEEIHKNIAKEFAKLGIKNKTRRKKNGKD